MKNLQAIPSELEEKPMAVTIGFLSGNLKTGALRAFDPKAERIDFEIAYTRENEQTKTMSLKVNPSGITYVAFRDLTDAMRPRNAK